MGTFIVKDLQKIVILFTAKYIVIIYAHINYFMNEELLMYTA